MLYILYFIMQIILGLLIIKDQKIKYNSNFNFNDIFNIYIYIFHHINNFNITKFDHIILNKIYIYHDQYSFY